MRLRADELQFNGIEGLAKAIVLQACNDWLALKQGKSIPKNSADELREYDIYRIEAFFKSKWYTILSECPAKTILARLEELHEG